MSSRLQPPRNRAFAFGLLGTLVLSGLAVAGAMYYRGHNLGGGSATWSIASERDPISDAMLQSATATFNGQRYNVEVRAVCAQGRSGPAITYYVTSFERNGQPAEMRSIVTVGGVFQSLEARVDDYDPFRVTNRNPRFNNQISIGSSSLMVERQGSRYIDSAGAHLARASTVALRLSLAGGDETIEFSQRDETLRNVLTPCLQQQERNRQIAQQRQREQETNDQREQQRQAEERQAQDRQDELRRAREQQAEEQRSRDQRAAYEQAQRDEQARLCEQIRRSGTSDPEYLRLQGCR